MYFSDTQLPAQQLRQQRVAKSDENAGFIIVGEHPRKPSFYDLAEGRLNLRWRNNDRNAEKGHLEKFETLRVPVHETHVLVCPEFPRRHRSR